MTFSRTMLVFIALVAAVALSPVLASAQQAAGRLTQLTFVDNAPLYDDLERAAADANQAVFNALDPICPNGICTPLPGESTSETAARQSVFEEVRELVDTADDILGGSPAFSLGLNDEDLGNALRWTAAEEVQSQARAATDFTNGQLTSAQNRITALRYGARGFSIAGLEGLPTRDYPTLPGQATLGSAGEENSGILAKLGGFASGSYGWGAHDPTSFEDAFDYESADFTIGVDYRVMPDLVVGLLGGYSQNEVDFDGSKSIVDGGIDALGFSLGAFSVYSWRDFYVSGFFSYQRMSFDIDRFITYPSLNPNVAGTNTRTKGETDSNAYTASANLGYTYRFGLGKGFGSGKPFLIEPSFRVEYSNIMIDKFTEDNVDPGENFALVIDDQEIESLEMTLGLRTSVAISTPVGVFFPYARAEWRFELENSTRRANSRYAGLGGVGVVVPFVLRSEEIDSEYGTITVGLQTIIRGGRSKILGGPMGDRLSVYAEYRRIFELDNIDSEILNGGLRYLF